MGNEVYRGEDGYWRVRGQPETTYYSSEEIAAQIARELVAPPTDGADETEDEQDQRIADELAGDEDDDQGEADAHDGHDQIPETE